MIKTFEQWMIEKHPEFLEEGWAKNLAMGGALLGAGMGIGGAMKGGHPDPKAIQSQSVTSDDAAEFLPRKAKPAKRNLISPDAPAEKTWNIKGHLNRPGEKATFSHSL